MSPKLERWVWNHWNEDKRLRTFLFDLLLGVTNGYPWCCVWFYSWLNFTRRSKGAIWFVMIAKDIKHVGYVRCIRCRDEVTKQEWRWDGKNMVGISPKLSIKKYGRRQKEILTSAPIL